MDSIEDIALEYEKRLNELYARANTKSKKRRILFDLFQFSDISYERFEIDKIYEWENDTKLINLAKDYRVPFAMNITKYDKLYSKIFNGVIDTFALSGFSAYDYYYPKYMKMSESEIQDIIVSFIESYDKNLVKIFEDKIDNKELFYVNLFNDRGATYTMPSINKNLIFYTTEYLDACTIETASTIVHEFGHCYEMNNLYKTGRTSFYELAYGTPYYEIFSRFLQYAFIMFLVENKIYLSDTKILLHEYYLEILNRSYDVVLLSKMDEIRPDGKDRVKLEDENVINEAKRIQEKINYFNLAGEKGDTIKYRHAYIYSIGTLMSLYLYESYKNDPERFKWEIRNSLLNYPYVNSLSAFENVGVTKDMLLEGSVLKRCLKK